MIFARPSTTPDATRHLALTNDAALTASAVLGRLIAGAGIDILEFSSRFENTSPAQEANEVIAHLQNWLRAQAPDHPILRLQILHVDDALALAGIGPESRFSTETAAYERNGNEHCIEDQEKWFAWIKSAQALHKCNWSDDDTAIVEDICEAIDKAAPILVLERLG